jgi:hypothetical protein
VIDVFGVREAKEQKVASVGATFTFAEDNLV